MQLNYTNHLGDWRRNVVKPNPPPPMSDKMKTAILSASTKLQALTPEEFFERLKNAKGDITYAFECVHNPEKVIKERE